MGCPKCQCEEISATGMCLWCGYQVFEPSKESGQDAKEKAEAPPVQAEIEPEKAPEWRQQLSQRLQSIKQKQDAVKTEQEESASSAAAESVPREPVKTSEPEISATDEKSPEAQAAQSFEERKPQQYPYTNTPFINTLKGARQTKSSDFETSPMMLLSRILSGLVDLIIIGLCMAFLILAADIFSGIKVLGLGSILSYAILFLLIFFLYSLFFFRISGQTIGMMITHLRVVTGFGAERPRIGRILFRCAAFLVSLFCFGLGLLWAFFDPDHRCFHDRLTDTRPVRIR
ncbi:MAG: RDD family protein [Acidobacteria bacterium]|nr:RDD family protein [Acidobacteriota bacterium]